MLVAAAEVQHTEMLSSTPINRELIFFLSLLEVVIALSVDGNPFTLVKQSIALKGNQINGPERVTSGHIEGFNGAA